MAQDASPPGRPLEVDGQDPSAEVEIEEMYLTQQVDSTGSVAAGQDVSVPRRRVPWMSVWAAATSSCPVS